MKSKAAYKRVLIKLSGEAFSGEEGYGIDYGSVKQAAAQIQELKRLGIEIAVVLGAGNLYRGKQAEKSGMERITGDYIGMMATAMNALSLQYALESLKVEAVVQTALAIDKVGEPYTRRNALTHLKNGRIVIFACGTGNPLFTTDTAAALRAIEMNADVLIKATKVNGVYDKDPEQHSDARFYPEITYSEVISQDLKVMDLTAITLCKENQLPVAVLNMRKKGNLKRAVLGEHIGTIVRR